MQRADQPGRPGEPDEGARYLAVRDMLLPEGLSEESGTPEQPGKRVPATELARRLDWAVDLPASALGDYSPHMTIRAEPERLPRAPLAKGLPILGHALAMRIDPLRLLVRLYRQLGPVFRVRAFHRRFTILAGRDANRFLHKQGHLYLSTRTLYGGVRRELGADTLLVALDGEPHWHLRKQMQRGMSRKAAEAFVDHFVETIEESTSSWRPGAQIAVLPFMERLVSDQLSAMMTGRHLGDMFQSIRLFLDTLMNVEMVKTWPRFMLKRPKYVRAKKKCMAFADDILATHRARGPGEIRDLIDDSLEFNTLDSEPLTRGDLRASVIGLYFAGLDTVASTMSYMMYAVLSDDDVLQRIRCDAARALQAGHSWSDFKTFEDLHCCVLETLRRWPAVPFAPRVVEKAFSFAGHRLDEGEEIIVAQCVTHMLDEFFPDPERFLLDRHKEPRCEYRQPGVFTPFGLGAHRCLGAGLAEMQMLITVAALIDRFDLELVVKGAPPPVLATPLPNPGRSFAIRVLGRR